MRHGLRRSALGMTMIELVVAIVILGVGISGMMLAFSTVMGASSNPIVMRQMQAIADEMVAEIALKPYVPVANSPAVGCARVNFNDVTDYNGYTTTDQICTIDGNPIPSLNGYSVNVAIQEGPWYSVPENKRIMVTVSNASQSYVLYRRRTGYAQ
ncbi:type IV pilus modification PilV family protein [Ideonella paludis]|uniref:Prepilin-type N-terminal cleavage/methylation domain-containing protein n=2 Tax=Ideonella paludis TaxID=1233411 RepID=A0ABS5E184_9BURK|nr:prepilin-type N-terminal cleavage/methylation domain-containing protein [Ideonella paludis]MBQ0937054.1 prepilin-type N-terminal cleavage/methylation domain-containing protein [Ideonella paludis]